MKLDDIKHLPTVALQSDWDLVELAEVVAPPLGEKDGLLSRIFSRSQRYQVYSVGIMGGRWLACVGRHEPHYILYNIPVNRIKEYTVIKELDVSNAKK